jgi:hypothetical protein
MSTALEITFTVFDKGKGAKLRTDFSESEAEQLNATPERSAAFKALRAATDEVEASESAFDAATKDLSARTRAFNDLKGELLAATPPRSFMDEWRASVQGKNHRG